MEDRTGEVAHPRELGKLGAVEETDRADQDPGGQGVLVALAVTDVDRPALGLGVVGSREDLGAEADAIAHRVPVGEGL